MGRYTPDSTVYVYIYIYVYIYTNQHSYFFDLTKGLFGSVFLGIYCTLISEGQVRTYVVRYDKTTKERCIPRYILYIDFRGPSKDIRC